MVDGVTLTTDEEVTIGSCLLAAMLILALCTFCCRRWLKSHEAAAVQLLRDQEKGLAGFQLTVHNKELVSEEDLRRLYAEVEELSIGGREAALREGGLLFARGKSGKAPKSVHDQGASRKLRSESFAASVAIPSGKIVAGADERFVVEPGWLVTGQPKDAARGLSHYLKINDSKLFERMVHGVAAIRQEFADRGTPEDQECLDYILNHPAGSSALEFPNGVRDCGRNGERLTDFVRHPNSQMSGLSEAHVLALRLYTSAAYKSLNTPLRNLESSEPHPFPVTICLLAEGIKRLRSVMAEDESANEVQHFWRGMRNLQVSDQFASMGGTEIAPMSTTSELAIAMRYAISPSSLLFKITTHSFMERGVDLSFLSCFPNEAEHLFAPLTYLRPTGCDQEITIGGSTVKIIEVVPTFGA